MRNILFASVTFGDFKKFLKGNNRRYNFCILFILQCEINHNKEKMEFISL